MPLIDDQIKARRFVVTENVAHERMSLAAVMSLMVEKMVQGRSKCLLDVLGIYKSSILDRPGKVTFAQGPDITTDALVLGSACGAKLYEIITKDRVEA